MSTPDKESFILTFEFSEYEDVHFCKAYYTKGVLMVEFTKDHASTKKGAMLNVIENLHSMVKSNGLKIFGIEEND